MAEADTVRGQLQAAFPKDKGFSLLVHPGGHHFNDDYKPVARDILDHIAPSASASTEVEAQATP